MSAERTLVLYLTVTVFSVLFMWEADRIRINTGHLLKRHFGYRPASVSKRELFIIASCLVLFSLIALRDDSVGSDYPRYIELYESIGKDALTETEQRWMMRSIGYWVINRVMYALGMNHHLLFAILGFITIYYLYKGIIEQSRNWALSVYIYICFTYYYLCFSMIRQMMAMTIVFYGFKYLMEGNLKRYIWVVLAASLFHMSALVCLIICPVYRLKMSIGTILAYVLAGCIFFFGFDLLIRLLSGFYYVSSYLSSSYAVSWEIKSIFNTAVRIIMLVFCLFFYKAVVKKDKRMIPFYNLIQICTVLQLGAMRFNIFGRLTAYFYMAYLVLLPSVFMALEEKFTIQNRKIIKMAVIALFACYHFVYYFSSRGAAATHYARYSFLWER